MVKNKKDRMVEIFIKRGKHVFIHSKSPMFETKAAKIMIKLIDFHTEQFGIRKARKRR